MFTRFLVVFTLLLSTSSLINGEVIEINSDTAYSNGYVVFEEYDSCLHFSTGLTLNFGRGFITNNDTALYTSYVVNTEYMEDSDSSETYNGIINFNFYNIPNWYDITSVDTSITILDYLQYAPNTKGHYTYFSHHVPEGNIVLIPDDLTQTLISQDSSGNYIKWQISNISTYTEENTIWDLTYVDLVTFHWEIDSSGNGEFQCNPVSNKDVVPFESFDTYTELVQENNTLSLQDKGTITLFGINGQLIKESHTGSVNIADLPKGIYIAKATSMGGSFAKRFRVK